MKRVLVVNTANTGFGGLSGVMMNYAMITSDKVRYDFVLTRRVEPGHKEILQRHADDIFIPPYSRIKQFPAYTWWLKKIMRQKKYDVVHVHGNSGTMYLEMLAAKSAGIPVRIVHSHSTSCKFMLAHKVMNPWMNRTKTAGIACSEKSGKWLFGDGAYTVLPNGIEIGKFAFDPETRQHYRKELGLENNFVIGHVGYMDWEKNQKYLIEVFAQLLHKRDNAKLLLIGDGKMRQEIEALISQKGLQDRILVLGKRADVAQLYQCMDVFVLPSVFEGFPVTLVEAQTAGLPCVVSDAITREVDLVDNMTFVPIGESDLPRWVDALCAVQEKNRDRFAAAMADTVFNIRKCADALLALYGVSSNN